jgi:hypothetical protein
MSRIGFQPEDRFMVALGNTLAVITQAGNVFGADIVNNEVGPGFRFTGAKVGFNPEDRFAVAVGNRILIITRSGNVFGHEVTGRDIGPAFQFGGSKMGFNPQDKFMVAAGHRLLVITATGSVFGADVLSSDIGPSSQIASGKIGFQPEDRFMVALGNKLAVITAVGKVFGGDLVAHQIGIVDPLHPMGPKMLQWELGPVVEFDGARIGTNPQDKFMVSMGPRLAVITHEGDTFAAEVEGTHVGPVSQINHEAPPPEPVLPDTLTFDSGSITSDLTIGGFARLVLSRNGDWTFSGRMHNSGALGIDFLLTMVVLSPDGLAVARQHGGTVAGHSFLSPGSESDTWTDTGNVPELRERWPQIVQSRGSWTLNADDEITHELEKALGEALKEALKQAGQAAVKALIELISA